VDIVDERNVKSTSRPPFVNTEIVVDIPEQRLGFVKLPESQENIGATEKDFRGLGVVVAGIGKICINPSHDPQGIRGSRRV
jgi:hypothetical protein